MRVTFVLLLTLLASLPAQAKIPAEEAAKLKTVLTPNGGEKAGNAEGTIPAWTGGLTISPPCFKGEGTRQCDPFPEDKPQFTINKGNLDKFKDRLSAGQQAMFKKFPDTYKMNVYQTRRTAAYPDFVDAATFKNATSAELISNGEGITGAIVGVPFPIPKSGVEPVWNHKVRYRGVGARRWNNQAAVTTSGDYNLVKLREDIRFSYDIKGATPESLDNVILFFFQVVMSPPRLAGTITLVHETMDQVKEHRRAWQYNPGQRRLRRAPNVAYDNPGTGADGLRTNDQTDTFNGATDRYTWKIIGKKELYIPYSAYKIHSDQYKISDIIKKGHINQDLARYELHRVWVVEGTVKPTTSHIYARRVFYIDEDTWQISVVDIYDRRGELWRWQESHQLQAYQKPFPGVAIETVYDLISNRYLAQAMNNEDEETLERNFDISYFDPANVQKQATK
jgi:hypothetical protein